MIIQRSKAYSVNDFVLIIQERVKTLIWLYYNDLRWIESVDYKRYWSRSGLYITIVVVITIKERKFETTMWVCEQDLVTKCGHIHYLNINVTEDFD